jgi:hypothetical protein
MIVAVSVIAVLMLSAADATRRPRFDERWERVVSARIVTNRIRPANIAILAVRRSRLDSRRIGDVRPTAFSGIDRSRWAPKRRPGSGPIGVSVHEDEAQDDDRRVARCGRRNACDRPNRS